MKRPSTAEDVHTEILEMFEGLSTSIDEANDALLIAEKERIQLRAEFKAVPTARDIEHMLDQHDKRWGERINTVRDGIFLEIQNMTGAFRKELDEALDQKLPRLVQREVERKAEEAEKLKAERWVKIKSTAQTYTAVISLITAGVALGMLFFGGHPAAKSANDAARSAERAIQ
jgi:sugar-specific transcriptional regulator TrmB